MEVGKLDRLITLETNTTTRSKSGQAVSTWGNPQDVWANVRYQTPREAFQGDQNKALQTAVFTIRYRTEVSAAKSRVIHDGQTYNITGVAEVGRRQGLQLFGEAVNNG